MSALQHEIDLYSKSNLQSQLLHKKALEFMPGGDTRNSIFWAPFPIYVVDADGTKIRDVDSNLRTDFANNMTTLILGHKHPSVVSALREQSVRGVSFPAPSPPVIRWAEIICDRVPSVEKIRFVNSGTEGTLNAIRAARAFSGKIKLAKCEGAYHGNHDAIQISVTPPLEEAGDEFAPNSVIMFPGINPSSAEDIVLMPYNNLEASERIIRDNADELAAVIVEPINGQCGWIPAKPEFLEGLRRITEELGIILIFDEVVTFRVSRGGAQELYGVTPDLTCFGKIIGGGLPVGAFGGRNDIMSMWDPSGDDFIQHAGTFNGNPMTAVAGIATLEHLTNEVYEELAEKGNFMRKKLRDLITELEVPMGVTGTESLFALQFTSEPVIDYRSFATNDELMRQTIFIGLLNEGYLLTNRCHANISAAHTESDIIGFVDALRNVLIRSNYA